MNVPLESVDRRDFVRIAAGVAAAGAAAVAPTAVSAEQAAEEQPSVPTIYIVDRIVAKPGKGREIYDMYLEHFEPFAAERGMVLDRAVIAPPVWLIDDVSSQTLEFSWACKGYPALAGSITYCNPAAVAWWDEIEALALSRDRSYFATSEDAEVLNNV